MFDFTFKKAAPSKSANHQHGFNLVEAAIVLGVIGLVIGGIWVAASAVNNSMKANRMASDIGYVLDRVSREVGARNTGTILYTDAVTSVSLFFPPGYVASGNNIYNPSVPGIWRLSVSQASLAFGFSYAYDADMSAASFASPAAYTGRSSMPRSMCAKFLPDLFGLITRLKTQASGGSFGIVTDAGAVIFGLPVGVDTLPATSFDALITICGNGFKGMIGPGTIYLR